MAAARDDDALTWEGDDDPTLAVGGAEAGEPGTPPRETASLPEGWNAVGKGSENLAPEPDASAVDEDEDREPAAGEPVVAESEPMGNVELISLGVLGGFALLYAVGWLIGGLRLQGTAQFLVAPVAYQVSLWLAVAAPLVWFVAVYLLTKDWRAWVRFAWLAAGVVLLVPWPFIMVGAIGQ